jgi:hypothetical protein
MAFLGFWVHFGRLFGAKIMKKGSQKSDENMETFLEAFWAQVGGVGGRAGGGGLRIW